jgi:hypothetical protein
MNPRSDAAQNQLNAIFSIEAGTSLFFNLGISGDSGIGFRFEASGSAQPFVSYNPTSSYANRWTHLAVVRNNTSLRLYINGILRDTASVTSGLVDGLSNSLLVGGSSLLRNFGLGGFFDGYLDDLRIYNRPITPTEVDSLAGNIATSTIPTLSSKNITQVWTIYDFRQQHPKCTLSSTTGSAVQLKNLVPGTYLWVDGQSKRRIILK